MRMRDAVTAALVLAGVFTGGTGRGVCPLRRRFLPRGRMIDLWRLAPSSQLHG